MGSRQSALDCEMKISGYKGYETVDCDYDSLRTDTIILVILMILGFAVCCGYAIAMAVEYFQPRWPPHLENEKRATIARLRGDEDDFQVPALFD